jgi:membrane-associated HD superfamily phosphohydrolase
MIRDRKKKAIRPLFQPEPAYPMGTAGADRCHCFYHRPLPGTLSSKNTAMNSGDVVKTDIKASEDFFIEDRAATEVNRRQAVDSVLIPVYDLNPKILKGTVSRLNDAFDQLRSMYEKETKNLETESQAFPPPLSASDTDRLVEPTDVPDLPQVPLAERMLAKKSLLEKAYRVSKSVTEAFSILIENGFQTDIPKTVDHHYHPGALQRSGRQQERFC